MTHGGARWRAHRGLATVMTQHVLEGQQERLSDALEQVRLYAEHGGPQDDWSRHLRQLLEPAKSEKTPENGDESGGGESGGDDSGSDEE